MSKIKLIIIITLLGVFSLSISSCKKNCKWEDPIAKIINNGTEKASVQIKTSGGNTVNINNVDPGSASPYSSYASGEVVFTITVSNINYVDTVLMLDCYDYDISIDANNNISTVATSRDD